MKNCRHAGDHINEFSKITVPKGIILKIILKDGLYTQIRFSSFYTFF